MMMMMMMMMNDQKMFRKFVETSVIISRLGRDIWTLVGMMMMMMMMMMMNDPKRFSDFFFLFIEINFR